MPPGGATHPVWGDPAAGGNPPPLEGDAAADLCVIGLGGSGLAAVGAALEAGASVVGIDAGWVGGGAAGRNGGFLLTGTARFHHDAVAHWGRERAGAIYAASLEELDRLAAELGPIVRRVGSVRIPASPEEEQDCAAQCAALRADGFAAEPAAGPSGTGVRVPDDGAIDPLARCRRLAAAAQAAGARLHTGTPALEVTGHEVRTPAGAVRCSAVVVCVDGGLERLLPELAGTVRSVRLQMLATAPLQAGRIPCPVYDNWGYDYWQQLPDGRVALGGGRDRFGAGNGSQRPDGPGSGRDRFRAGNAAPAPTAAVQAHLEALLARRVGVDAPVTHRWAGEVAFTDDCLPVLAEIRARVVASGAFSGHGNVLGSAAGRAATAIALGGPVPALARALRPEHWE